jgi:hypothetical protein
MYDARKEGVLLMKRIGTIIALVVAATALCLPAAAVALSGASLSGTTTAIGAHPFIGTRPQSNPGSALGALGLPSNNTTSTNWSGYAVQSIFPTGVTDSVSEVKASWVVPTVTGGTTDAYSANWIGIDGYSSSTVEQIGTEQDWNSGVPVYYAWWEMYPNAEEQISGISVHPGDAMDGEITWTSGNQFRLTLTDVTTSQTFTTLQTVTGVAQRNSAEWIVEAPSSRTGVLPFATLGPSTFTSCSVTVNGTTGSISGADWQYDQMTLTDDTGVVTLAEPSALTAGGSAFVVTSPSVTTHTITATPGSNGSISPSGAQSVTDGGSKTFTITANSGYHISDVLVDGISVGAVSSYAFSDVTADHTISATFAADTAVTTSLTIHRTVSSVKHGKAVRIYGRLIGGLPSHTKIRLRVQKNSGSYTYVTGYTTSTGSYSFSYKLSKVGTYHFQTSYAGTTGFKASTSATLDVKSK